LNIETERKNQNHFINLFHLTELFMRRLNQTIALAALMLGAFPSFSQEETTVVEIVEVADSTVEQENQLTISGYVDLYYSHNFNNPKYAGGFAVQNEGRIFDIKNNQFSLGLAQAKFLYNTKRSEVVLDLTFGPNAELGNFGNIFGSMIGIKQAYFAYKLTDNLSFTAGQFGTHVGYELIDAPANFNYSLSYLFGNGPFYHTGLKLNYQINDAIGVMAGVVNGWDEMFDFNKGKDAIAQISITPSDDFGLYINYVGGDDKNGLSFPTIGSPGSEIPDTIKTYAHLFDITTAYQLTEDFKIGLNAAYGFGNLNFDPVSSTYSNADWYGAALYLDYYIVENFGLGLRAEHFADPNGVRYIGASYGAGTYNEFTLTGDILLAKKHIMIKPEVRLDVAGQKSFHKELNLNDGTFSSLTNTQLTTGIAFIYAF
jgi:hypothetical protein